MESGRKGKRKREEEVCYGSFNGGACVRDALDRPMDRPTDASAAAAHTTHTHILYVHPASNINDTGQ